MQITKKIVMEVWEQNNITVHAVQGEANARFLEIHLRQDNEPLDLTGKTAAIYYQKPDGKQIFNACAIPDPKTGVVIAELTPQMSAAAGRVDQAEIWVFGTDDALLKVRAIQIDFYPSDYSGAIESTDELTALQQALQNAGDLHLIRSLAEAAISSEEKGASSGVATLDASGKLEQMPTAADVGAIPTSQKGASSGVATLNAEGQVVQPPAALPGPNLLINSDFAINQRGQETYTRTTQKLYTFDRWLLLDAISVTRQTNTSPANTPYEFKVTINPATWNTVTQPMENFQQRLLGKTVTVSFWAKASAAGKIRFRVGGTNTMTTIDVNTSWKKFTYTLSDITYADLNTSGLCFHTNSASETVLTDYTIAAPQLVLGTSVGEYVQPDPVAELQKCHRFYYQSQGNRIYGYTQADNMTTKQIFPSFAFQGGFRTTPQVTMPENGIIIRGNNVDTNIQQINAVYSNDSAVDLEAVAISSVGNREAISGWFDTNNPTIFDAEIYE